jgi:hypothetical protein
MEIIQFFIVLVCGIGSVHTRGQIFAEVNLHLKKDNCQGVLSKNFPTTISQTIVWIRIFQDSIFKKDEERLSFAG